MAVVAPLQLQGGAAAAAGQQASLATELSGRRLAVYMQQIRLGYARAHREHDSHAGLLEEAADGIGLTPRKGPGEIKTLSQMKLAVYHDMMVKTGKIAVPTKAMSAGRSSVYAKYAGYSKLAIREAAFDPDTSVDSLKETLLNRPPDLPLDKGAREIKSEVSRARWGKVKAVGVRGIVAGAAAFGKAGASPDRIQVYS